MPAIAVLGAGLVGSAIVKDLSARHHVHVADRSGSALDAFSLLPNVETNEADVTDRSSLNLLVEGADLVVSAVPGHLGYEVLRSLIEAKKTIVDIAFSPEDTTELYPLAVERGVTALVDFGVAPGIDNLLLGYHDARMTVLDFECLVGGLPVERTHPFEYKAPFSPIDVIEEYTRPARLMVGGEIVTKAALTDIEPITFPGVGTLEAFNTDGLRSLLTTMSHIPNMREKTLRYPGHAKLIQSIKDAGFFGTTPIRAGDVYVAPKSVAAALLMEAWRQQPGEDELTAFRVSIKGHRNGESRTITYEMLDRYDQQSGISSMARTTGYACTAAVELLLQGKWTDHGVFPPEIIGSSETCFTHVMDHLTERGVTYRQHSEGIERPRGG